MQEIIIKTEGLTKRFDNKAIIENANIEILKGEAVAFIGPNGSGKSTMLKLIAGLITATRGKVNIKKDLKISYIPERFDKTNMTVHEFVTYMGKIEGLNKNDMERMAEQFYLDFFLQDMKNTPMKFLSKGTLQKVAVIQAILVKPDILLLDEPLSGQDYNSQRKFLDKMLEFKSQGVTIIMSCHEQFLIEQLADRILKIVNKMFIETVDFAGRINLSLNLLLFQVNLSSESFSTKDIIKMNGVQEVNRRDNKIQITVKKEYSQSVLKKMLQEGYILLKFDEI